MGGLRAKWAAGAPGGGGKEEGRGAYKPTQYGQGKGKGAQAKPDEAAKGKGPRNDSSWKGAESNPMPAAGHATGKKNLWKTEDGFKSVVELRSDDNC